LNNTQNKDEFQIFKEPPLKAINFESFEISEVISDLFTLPHAQLNAPCQFKYLIDIYNTFFFKTP